MKVIFAKSVCAWFPTEDVSGDEALALQLQLEMDREARAAGNVEEAGLFFCQLVTAWSMDVPCQLSLLITQLWELKRSRRPPEWVLDRFVADGLKKG